MPNLIKHFVLLCLILVLTGCTCSSNTTIIPTTESWLCQLRHSPDDWLQGADAWFVTGHSQPKATVGANSIMKIAVPDFDKIVVSGNFKVQLVSTTQRNQVAILGQYAATRQVLIDIHQRTLYITQPKDCPMNLASVIVRVYVRDLKCLTQLGCGGIYGRGIVSSALAITSRGTGPVMLMGNMNVRSVDQSGPNTITLLGVNAPALMIRVAGNGRLNLCGQVGARAISHHGNGKIDILGLNTPSLTIETSGSGVTQAEGIANLRSVAAQQNSRVYLSWVQSDGLTVLEQDQAKVGLAGTVSALNIETKNAAQFQGQYLYARNAFVKTYNSSHANINATQKMFLDAHQNSSIYYYSNVKELATFPAGQSIILYTPGTPSACAIACPMLRKHIGYKGE